MFDLKMQLGIMLLVIVVVLIPHKVMASELECMAKNIYFEARGESEAGQFMVGFVTMNRLRDNRWPDTICEVVFERGQFSWTFDEHLDTPISGEQYNKIIYIASIVMQSHEIEQYGLYFKRSDVKSRFFNKLTKIATVDNHSFYGD